MSCQVINQKVSMVTCLAHSCCSEVHPWRMNGSFRMLSKLDGTMCCYQEVIAARRASLWHWNSPFQTSPKKTLPRPSSFSPCKTTAHIQAWPWIMRHTRHIRKNPRCYSPKVNRSLSYQWTRASKSWTQPIAKWPISTAKKSRSSISSIPVQSIEINKNSNKSFKHKS